MKDRLEEFVKANRGSFDEETPGTHVWKGINQNLPGKRNNYSWLWQAAAVFFFATSVYLFVNRLQPVEKQVASGDNFSQVEDFYFREINQKRALIHDLSESGVSAEAELQKLDAMYLVLKEQFRENPSKEVTEALTLNLIVRLDLLNQVVADLEQEEEVDEENASGTQIEI